MQVAIDEAASVVRKRADTDAERVHLGHEAAMLRAAAHPGVVRLLRSPSSDAPDELLLALAPGGHLGGRPILGVAGAAGLGAALATTVADLHHLGVVHRRIDASHVLLDEEGRPLLCGFGQSGRVAPGDGTQDRRDDVRAVADLVRQRMGSAAPRPVLRVLRAAGGGRRPASARWLARQLVAAVPEACLPGCLGDAHPGERQPPAPPRSSIRRSSIRRWSMKRWSIRRRLAVAAVGAALAGAGGWLVTRPAPHPGPLASGLVTVAPCPAVDDGCAPLPTAGGVLAVAGQRYAISRGGVVVVGRWACGPPLPALLDARSGEVWAFAGWATSHLPARAHLVGRFPGAMTLQVVPRRTGCDQLRVTGPGRPSETIAVAP